MPSARTSRSERSSGHEAHKEAIRTFYSEVLSQGRTDLVQQLVAESYEPHVPRFAQPTAPAAGRQALLERLRASGPVRNEVKRLIADEDFVFTHVKYPGPVPLAGSDIFRLDEAGKICAHWSVRQPLGRSSADVDERFASAQGLATAATWERAALKKLVRRMLDELWAKGDSSLVPKYYAKSYIQHNPEMPGGFARIQEVVDNDIRGYIAATGRPYPIEVHHIGAEGDLVFVHLSISMAGINRNAGDSATNVDIFRVDDSALMIEHWDVLQMASEALPNASSLF
jgi:predicted SnoaL-like aldol condensation-catalyzing enzyme